jgi:hypothetical protein
MAPPRSAWAVPRACPIDRFLRGERAIPAPLPCRASAYYVARMFEDWKRAWREAVANFHQELRAEDDGPGGVHTRALRRELATARGAFAQLGREIRDTLRQRDDERAAASDCSRREQLARSIGDEETVRLAIEFGARHTERADVLARKVDVLEAERELLARDLEKMDAMIGPELTPPPERAALHDDERDRAAAEFRDLNQRERERAAAERLEELKRRMQR